MSELPTRLDTQQQRAEYSIENPEKHNTLDLLTLTKSDHLKSAGDSLPSKILRSTTLLTAGVAGGAFERSAELLTDKKGTAALEFGAAAAIGYGLKTMTEVGGRWGQAAKAGTVLLGLGLAADVYNRGSYAVGAISDNWQSPENYARNKDIVGRAIGAALPDYSLMALGGYIGLNPRLAGEKAGARLSDLGSKAVEHTPPGIRENRFLNSSLDAMHTAIARIKNSEFMGRLKPESGFFGGRSTTAAEVLARTNEAQASAQSPRLMDRLAALDHSMNGGKPSYFDSPSAGVLRSGDSSTLANKISLMEFKGLNLNSIKLVETNLRTTIIPISLISYNPDSKLPRQKS